MKTRTGRRAVDRSLVDILFVGLLLNGWLHGWFDGWIESWIVGQPSSPNTGINAYTIIIEH